MSILADFYTLAGPVFNGRAYRNFAPSSPQLPYAVFFRVSGVEGTTLDANGGDDNEVETRIQIDIWSKSGVEVDSLATALKGALKVWSVSNTILLEMDGSEPELELHRITLDIQTIK